MMSVLPDLDRDEDWAELTPAARVWLIQAASGDRQRALISAVVLENTLLRARTSEHEAEIARLHDQYRRRLRKVAP